MINNVNIVGRLVYNPKLEIKNNKKYAYITLAVHRYYKNEEGIYETDFIRVLLENNTALTTCEYCEKGDVIGIVGRIETRFEEDKEREESRQETYIIADKVSFIASGRK